jgi:hypothetical protein
MSETDTDSTMSDAFTLNRTDATTDAPFVALVKFKGIPNGSKTVASETEIRHFKQICC